jgi:hypothetical protein
MGFVAGFVGVSAGVVEVRRNTASNKVMTVSTTMGRRALRGATTTYQKGKPNRRQAHVRPAFRRGAMSTRVCAAQA